MNNDLNIGKQLWNYEDIRKDIDMFLDLYEQRPIKDNKGGMLSPHLFWAWYV